MDKIDGVIVNSFEIPIDHPHSDGTLEWRKITLVLVEIRSGEVQGVGYTYAHRAVAVLIHDTLIPLLLGKDAMSIPEHWEVMVRSIRNLGCPGIASMAISAVDVALWDRAPGGITGFLRVAALARAYSIPLSTHTAPALHLHIACSEAMVMNLEYFEDHAKIERAVFDGFMEPQNGFMTPDLSRLGLGLDLRRRDLNKIARAA